MRASNQQDLIYKRGQAGVTKASVTIVFDNSDRSKSPTGFENFRQITVTRQVFNILIQSHKCSLTCARHVNQIALPNVSKYLLNGHKALQANIQTLFQGVQLNINNPNFVIMQGRITKVLNMRPQEILGMVEEAAGTRMFEEQKDKARKKMGRKEKSVLESKATLLEEINPKLEKLRSEKRSFIQFQKSVSELERTARILHALEWRTYQDRMHEKEEKIDEKQTEIKQVESEKRRAIKDGEAAEKEVVKVSKKRDAEMSKGGKLKILQDKASELGKVVAKIRTQAEIKVGTIKDEEAKIKTCEAQLKEVRLTSSVSIPINDHNFSWTPP